MKLNEIVDLEKKYKLYNNSKKEVLFKIQINVENGQKIWGSTMAINETAAIIKNYHNLKSQDMLSIVESIVILNEN